ncbi:hypothetical protein NA56DRAFT_748364 [Hyaloscypha hepaticicola]|uniref:Uncharacterized protein n=1 Tax=Hyaloscypha hepaticicola TaxID=2082293 RepID=A0A2J6Q6Y1_9HELO|nr:hypothetical protein NA56DRAFT_748364 [Hyaloscypha hepaticicola]
MSAPIDAGFDEIDPAGDLTIMVCEYDFRTTDGRSSHLLVKTATMKVSRKEGSRDVIEFHEDTICSAELWLRALHGNLIDDSYLIEREGIYNAIAFSRKYFIHLQKLNKWFEIYWSRLDRKNLEMDDLGELIYLAYSEAFDHPKAFAYVTLKMAHTGDGHIEEHNPSRHRELHVPGRVIQQLNAAKGSMRKEILRAVFEPLEPGQFCSTKCAVWEKSVVSYLDSLQKTGIWPIHGLHKKCNEDIVDGDGFVHWKCDIPTGACSSCILKLEGHHIKKTRTMIHNYWDGVHNSIQRWDKNCRISHARNTWYFSFMGRQEIMNSFQKAQQERKQERNRAARQGRFPFSRSSLFSNSD